MARSESRTKTSIWSDPDFTALVAVDQRNYWLLYSQPTISLCGVLPLTARRWASMAADTTVDDLMASLDRLGAAGFILVDRDTEEVLIRTFALHDGVGRSPKTLHAAYRQLPAVASQRLRMMARDALFKLGPPPEDLVADSPPHTPPDSPFDTPSSLGINGVSDTPPDRTGVRARAVSSLQSPSPDSCLPPNGVTHSANGTGASHRGERPNQAMLVELARQIANVCKGDNRQVVNSEAAAVVAWAAPVVDKRVIEESIGWAKQQADPPLLPRMLAGVILKKARDSNIPMHPFQVKTR